MNDRLKTFLSAYIDWIEAGAPADEPFCQCTGLCDNFECWLADNSVPMDEILKECDRLADLFVADGLDSTYPFGGEEVYLIALSNDTQHTNETRIAWVRAKVTQFEAA